MKEILQPSEIEIANKIAKQDLINRNKQPSPTKQITPITCIIADERTYSYFDIQKIREWIYNSLSEAYIDDLDDFNKKMKEFDMLIK